MKHTQGDWKIQHGDTVSRIFVNTKIADVYSTAFGDKENQMANAQLMAAAPDLLAACQDSVEAVETLRDAMLTQGLTDAARVLDEVAAYSRAAIAKAAQRR